MAKRSVVLRRHSEDRGWNLSIMGLCHCPSASRMYGALKDSTYKEDRERERDIIRTTDEGWAQLITSTNSNIQYILMILQLMCVYSSLRMNTQLEIEIFCTLF